MTALNLQTLVCITGFIMAIHFYCDAKPTEIAALNPSVKLARTVIQIFSKLFSDSSIGTNVGGHKIEFFISSKALDWQASVNECNQRGGHLANLMDNDEIKALKEALKYHDLREKKFWIYTCADGSGGYCHGECTEVSLQTDNRLAVIPFYGDECTRKKRYICEEEIHQNH